MSQPVKLIALLKAAPGMSRVQFGRRWVDGHAPVALRFKHLKGYRINIATLLVTRETVMLDAGERG